MRTLVIGYGNASRRDDGVGLAVVNALRLHWGQPALTPLTDGGEDLGSARDSLFLQQLTPELAATLAQYDLVFFVDASLPAATEPVQWERVEPAYQMGAISHHMEPATLLALARQLYGHAPEGVLVSVHGHDFDFGDELSPRTAAAVPDAVQWIEQFVVERENVKRET